MAERKGDRNQMDREFELDRDISSIVCDDSDEGLVCIDCG